MRIKQIKSYLVKLAVLTALYCGIILANAPNISAQFTFNGDFDKTFAAPNGYYVEPQNNFPADTVNPARRTYLFTGDYAPDGSVIAGGRIERNGGDFWLRKFTASGVPDASFGGGTGYVRTVFSTDFTGVEGNSLPTVLKRQADGKIVFGGVCDVLKDQANSTANTAFGTDLCLVRYNADGSIDSGFGNNIVQWSNGPNITYSQFVGAGRVATQTTTRESGLLGGTGLS
ncbi:MAG: delta-60 repeat domain-containing protein, partial [Actinomycetota bacterium]